mmetsp:Transcript_131082/g.379224  ORF Transcript_131082/g.379224 Transcript_131082/m.379224 type:complete len:259 (+) Transcript_131082:259-1035(+)
MTPAVPLRVGTVSMFCNFTVSPVRKPLAKSSQCASACSANACRRWDSPSTSPRNASINAVVSSIVPPMSATRSSSDLVMWGWSAASCVVISLCISAPCFARMSMMRRSTAARPSSNKPSTSASRFSNTVRRAASAGGGLAGLAQSLRTAFKKKSTHDLMCATCSTEPLVIWSSDGMSSALSEGAPFPGSGAVWVPISFVDKSHFGTAVGTWFPSKLKVAFHFARGSFSANGPGVCASSPASSASRRSAQRCFAWLAAR